MSRRAKTAFQIQKEGLEDLVEEEIAADSLRAHQEAKMKQVRSWLIVYSSATMLYLLVVYRISTIEFPQIVLNIGIFLAVAASIIIGISAISSTRLAVPAILVVSGTGVLNDIRETRARAFDKIGGPTLGYLLSVFFFVLYFILINIRWTALFR